MMNINSTKNNNTLTDTTENDDMNNPVMQLTKTLGLSAVIQRTRTLSLSHTWKWLLSMAIEYLPGTRSISRNFPGSDNNQPVPIGPYSLVQLAYHGELSQQGIPSHIALLNAHRASHINAMALVKGAVQARLLSTTALTDLAYLQAIETGFLLHYLLHPSEL